MATILVVEDERTVLNSIGSVLQSEGYNVTLIEDCHAALNTLKEDHFDLIISDIRLGSVNGIDLLRESKSRNPDTPFMLISAYPTELILREAEVLGVDRFMAKAFHVDEIINAVKTLLPAAT